MTKQHRSLRRRLVPAILIAVAALVLQPQPVMSQSSTLGIVANDIFGALLGAGAGEGLGCLVQGCSSSSGVDWSTVSTQLTSLSTQIKQMNGAIQASNCTTSAGVYSTFMSGDNTNTLNSIAILAADLKNIAADRQSGNKSQLTKDLIQLALDEKTTANLSTIHADMNGIVRGSAAASGGIQLYSAQLTACHTYFNSNDFLLVQQQWALFALAQANACLVKINLDNSVGGDPTNDINACKAYQLDINAAQVPQMANASSASQPLQSSSFIDVKTGIGWQVGSLVNASCQKLWDNGGGNAFTVCSIPGTSRSGAPWQALPYYQDVQTMLNDSQCPNNTTATCWTNQGWPGGGAYFWADGDYKNVVDPSPKGPWGGSSFCESNNCKCAHGDCYDWFNVVYQDGSGNTVPSFPPCWTYAAGDPYPSGLIAWRCGAVDGAAAGFNPVSQPTGAYNLSEWVGNGAANFAPGAPFPSGYYWTGAPPFQAAYVAAARQPAARPGTVETATETRPAETATATPARGR